MSTYRNPSNHRRRKVTYHDSSDGFISIFLYYVLPFAIVNALIFFCVTTSPKYRLTVGETHDYLTTDVSLTIDSWFPTKSITFTMDAEPIEMIKVKNRSYRATITKNGVLEANITNINGMSSVQFAHIDILDDGPPEILASVVEDGIITLSFSDAQSGINLDSIYALNSSDERLEPLTLDRPTATVTFEMDSAGLRIYAQDMAGNQVQGTFTSYVEGDEEILEGGETHPAGGGDGDEDSFAILE